jgi:hypothetical protein
MSTKNKKDNTEIINTVNGTMTFWENDNRQKLLDFMCTEYVELEPFIADCKVQGMRDGNVYITEKPKRIHNKPLFREDNSTLTLGRDGRYYFVFTLPKERVRELPDKLVHQALAIAQKVTKMNTKRGEMRGCPKLEWQ